MLIWFWFSFYWLVVDFGVLILNLVVWWFTGSCFVLDGGLLFRLCVCYDCWFLLLVLLGLVVYDFGVCLGLVAASFAWWIIWL